MHKSTFKNSIKTLQIAFQEIYKLQSWILPVTMIEAIINSIRPFVNIYMSARIIDELIGTKNINLLIKLVLVTISLNLVIHLISNGLSHLMGILRGIMMKNQQMRLNEKIITMDYEHVENPEVHNLRTKIAEAQKINCGIHVLIEHIGELVKGFVTVVISMLLVIDLFKLNIDAGGVVNTRTFSCIFLGILLMGTILTLKIQSKGDKKIFHYYNKAINVQRIGAFYVNLVLDYNAGKAIRLCNQKKVISKELTAYDKGTSRMFTDIGNINGKYGGFKGFVSSLVSGIVYLFVALKAMSGAITIGSIVQYVGSMNQFMAGSEEVLTSINSIINNNQYVQLYLDFLNIESKTHKGTLPVEKRDDDEYEIEFKNVSFKYPGTEEYALKNLSMKLSIGQRLAIVGMNGSGKTTFIKLLCRLYDPNEGEILLNGINIKKYDYEEYMRLFSIVFQDFKLFSFSLGQNVATSVEYDEKAVKEVLDKAGLEKRLETLPKSVKTSLYKDYDENGVEISGGEAQKIALARALHRDTPIIILDEPTAALDPISEFEIYSKFNEIVGTKTALYISHRLSSCRFCDEIAVFNGGEIVQKGSHEELLKDEDGKYYELWYSQAQYYNDEASA